MAPHFEQQLFVIGIRPALLEIRENDCFTIIIRCYGSLLKLISSILVGLNWLNEVIFFMGEEWLQGPAAKNTVLYCYKRRNYSLFMRLRLRKLVGFEEKSLGVSMTIN